MTDTMDAAVAIANAIEFLKEREGSSRVNETILRLQEILDQRGCEHFDPYVENDGRLTSLIDVIIDG
jgi:hypothetical protein